MAMQGLGGCLGRVTGAGEGWNEVAVGHQGPSLSHVHAEAMTN